jgi:hypothetical protein
LQPFGFNISQFVSTLSISFSAYIGGLGLAPSGLGLLRFVSAKLLQLSCFSVEWQAYFYNLLLLSLLRHPPSFCIGGYFVFASSSCNRYNSILAPAQPIVWFLHQQATLSPNKLLFAVQSVLFCFRFNLAIFCLALYSNCARLPSCF